MQHFRLLAMASLLAISSVATTASAQPTDASSVAGLKTIIQDAVRELFAKEPQILTQAMQAQQAKERQAQTLEMTKAVGPVALAAQTDARVPSTGPKNGKVITEFFDYNCGYCKQFATNTIAPLTAKRDDIRMVYVYTPVLGPGSVRLAEFVAAAQLQGKFVPAHEFLITSKSNHSTVESADGIMPDLIKAAGLDKAKFDRALSDGSAKAIVAHHTDMSKRANVRGTPMIYSMGEAIPGAIPLEPLVALLDRVGPKTGA